MAQAAANSKLLSELPPVEGDAGVTHLPAAGDEGPHAANGAGVDAGKRLWSQSAAPGLGPRGGQGDGAVEAASRVASYASGVDPASADVGRRLPRSLTTGAGRQGGGGGAGWCAGAALQPLATFDGLPITRCAGGRGGRVTRAFCGWRPRWPWAACL